MNKAKQWSRWAMMVMLVTSAPRVMGSGICMLRLGRSGSTLVPNMVGHAHLGLAAQLRAQPDELLPAVALRQRLAPLGPVYQAGTLSGNPVAVAAGLAGSSESSLVRSRTLSPPSSKY